MKAFNMTVIKQQNRGLTVSNNNALRLTKGEYIARVDADDFLHPEMLMTLVSKLEED